MTPDRDSAAPDGEPEEPTVTAAEQREATRGANRTVALLLLGVTLLFLGGAFGVGLLVLYGPF